MNTMMKLVLAGSALALAVPPALAQMDRRDAPYDRPADSMYDRPSGYDTPREEVYQGMRTSPTERHQGNVTFITGGVGKAEADRYRAMMSRYVLGLEFAQTSGNQQGVFLADVDVTITDSRGETVLRTTSEGPFLLANLPAGQYTVRANSDGRVKTRSVNVTPGGNQHLVFTW